MFGKNSYYKGQETPRSWSQLKATALGGTAVMDVLGVALDVLLGLAPVLWDAAVFFWLLSLPWPWKCAFSICNMIHFHFHLLFSSIISSLWGRPCCSWSHHWEEIRDALCSSPLDGMWSGSCSGCNISWLELPKFGNKPMYMCCIQCRSNAQPLEY